MNLSSRYCVILDYLSAVLFIVVYLSAVLFIVAAWCIIDACDLLLRLLFVIAFHLESIIPWILWTC